MTERIKLPVSVHLFLLKENEILLLKRFNTGFEDGKYSVLAGHIDGNESVSKAIIREAYEEAGIIVEKTDLKPIQVMHRNHPETEYIDYFFATEKWEGVIENKEPDKCNELKWFKIDALPSNIIDYIKIAIDNYKNNIAFSEHGW